MPVRFKVAFTIPAETLFGLLARVLPIEDLSVAEVIEHPPIKAAPTPRVQHAIGKPKLKLKRDRARAPNDLSLGLNGIILSYLADGKPHRAVEIKAPLAAAGFSPNSVGSALNRLAERKLVFQPEMGLWQLAQQPVAESA
jgi:hypothetical protein